jgi:hypothetical protein
MKDILDYVLVYNLQAGFTLVYYTGYYKKYSTGETLPCNTLDYSEAMKCTYRKEAQVICDKINSQTEKGITSIYTYHVEEHMYMSK